VPVGPGEPDGVGVGNGLHGNTRLTNSPLGRVPVITHLQPPPRGILQGLTLIKVKLGSGAALKSQNTSSSQADGGGVTDVVGVGVGVSVGDIVGLLVGVGV
jgi:hypothetical protein